MKKILRYGLWLNMIAWSLLLNDIEILGILVAILSTVYICYFTKNLNYWRISSLFLVSSLFAYLLVTISNLTSIYHLLIPFLIVINLNTSLMNEVVCKLKASAIMPIYLSITVVLALCLALAILIPYTPLLPFYKTNLLIFIFLIFFPTFLQQSICVLSKSIRAHKQIQKLYN